MFSLCESDIVDTIESLLDAFRTFGWDLDSHFSFLFYVFYFNTLALSAFFLICRRARRQRSQSPVLGTSRIDKHFELYKKLKMNTTRLSETTSCSQLASQVIIQKATLRITSNERSVQV